MKKITNACVYVMNRFLPDAFLFAVILSIVVFVVAMLATGQGPMAMLYSWNAGFWGLLGFAMQMSLVIVLGSAMAKAKFFKKILSAIAGCAHSPTQAAMITALVSAICFWLNWGFALIFSAMLAKEMARQITNVDYRILVAAGYSGIAITQCGVGGSVLLTIAAQGGVANVCAYEGAIPLSTTVFNPATLIACGVIMVMLPILFKFMTPDAEHTVKVDPAKLKETEYVDKAPETPAEKLEISKILWVLPWAAGLVAFIYVLVRSNFDLSINAVNFLFLFLGILCHGNLKNYIRAFQDSASAAAGILLQFPFYAGIMGMMTAANADGVSLANIITNGLLSISTPRTLPFFTWISAAILNFFIPSGGGQWAVQAPIMLSAAMEQGTPLSTVSTALLWGDAWTNLIQPFWALPALGVAGLAAKDIMGYLVIVLIATGIVIGVSLLLIYPLFSMPV